MHAAARKASACGAALSNPAPTPLHPPPPLHAPNACPSHRARHCTLGSWRHACPGKAIRAAARIPAAGLQAVNGILIPGGAQNLRPGQPFFDVVSQLYDLAIQANDKGEYFPVSWAVRSLLTHPIGLCREASRAMLGWSSACTPGLARRHAAGGQGKVACCHLATPPEQPDGDGPGASVVRVVAPRLPRSSCSCCMPPANVHRCVRVLLGLWHVFPPWSASQPLGARRVAPTCCADPTRRASPCAASHYT